jgi:hypothetical protein
VAVLDTRISSETANYLGWRDIPEKESRNYQYNVRMNGKPVLIETQHQQSTVDMKDKPLLDAYYFVYDGKVVYNTYNLLRGDDDWDPMGIKNSVAAAENKQGRSLTNLPVS